MFKKTMLTALSVIMFGCVSAHTKVPEIVTDVQISHVESKPVDEVVKVSGTGWHATLPNDWMISSETPESNVGSVELLAKTKKKIGDTEVVAGLLIVPWSLSQGNPEDLITLISSYIANRTDIVLLQLDNVEFKGSTAMIALYIVPENKSLMFQIVATHDDHGYIFKCVGDVENKMSVLKTCRDLINSITTKD